MPLDKGNRESVDDNSCNSNECNKIPDHELCNKTANDNSKNYSRVNKNHQNSTNSFNNSRTVQYDVGRNDLNNENMQKRSSTQSVYIVGDSTACQRV